MLYTNFATYQAKQAEGGFSGAVCENNFFATLIVHDGFDNETGPAVLRKLATEIAEAKIEVLADFDHFIADFCKKESFPAIFSLSCAYLNAEVFLLKTIGEGGILLGRKRDLSTLIEGNNSASGYVENGDVFVFTTGSLFSHEEHRLLLKKVLQGDLPKAPEELSRQIKDDSSSDTTLLVGFEYKEATLTHEEEVLITDQSATVGIHQNESKPNPIIAILKNAKEQLQGQDQKKKTTMIVLSIVLVVFIWSVVLGYQRRSSAQTQKRIQETKEIVLEKLTQAEDVSFLNLGRATALITEARQDITALKAELGGQGQKELAELDQLVSQKEEKILKKEDRSSEEFFDLSVEDKSAQGAKMSLDGDTVAILDSTKGAEYILSLPKKSLTRVATASTKGGDLVARSGDTIFVYKDGVGVIAVGIDGKESNVVKDDPDWGRIVAMVTYNNNIYLLDAVKQDIYKYVPISGGFSEKSSYFKGQDKPNLTNSNSLAIDLSVYVGFPETIAKFTSGISDGFAPAFPETGISMIKILTDTNIEKVYAWDKKKSAIYVVNKEGTYERQIKSEIFATGADVVVYDTNAFIIKGSKVYTVDLN